MSRDLARVQLGDDKPKLVWFRCTRCQRFAQRTRHALAAAYAPEMTLGAIALRTAATGRPPCALADGEHPSCRAYPESAPVEHWAMLEDAHYGGWVCLFYCERRHASLKAAKSCPGPMRLHVPSLIVALGVRFPLNKLYRAARCPLCGSEIFEIRWEVPAPPVPVVSEPDFEAKHLARIDAELKRRSVG